MLAMTVVIDQPSSLNGVTKSHSSPRPRLLMLTHRLPYPPDRGDRIRSYHILKVFAQHFDVAIACTSDEPVWLQHHQLLSTMAQRVAIQPISVHASRFKSMTAMLTGRSFTPSYYFRQGLADTIVQWHEEAPFDVVWTFCTGMIQYASLIVSSGGSGEKGGLEPPIRRDAVRKVFHVLDLVDVDSLKWHSYARDSWPPIKWVYAAEARRLRKVEAGQFVPFDAAVVVSNAEAKAYRQGVGDHAGLTVVSNGVDLDYFSPEPDSDSKTIVFIGVLNYKPNVEGIVWFVQRVFGRLREQIGDVRLMIIGRHPTARVEALDSHAGVDVVGSVPDVRVYLRRAAVVVAPLQMARGVQNKVLEAMACGRVVVCSPQAAEGIHAHDGQHLLVADQPGHWASQLQIALTDARLRQEVGAAARHHVVEHYSWGRRLQPIIELLNGRFASGTQTF